jgi:hypothetical protein
MPNRTTYRQVSAAQTYFCKITLKTFANEILVEQFNECKLTKFISRNKNYQKIGQVLNYQLICSRVVWSGLTQDNKRRHLINLVFWPTWYFWIMWTFLTYPWPHVEPHRECFSGVHLEKMMFYLNLSDNLITEEQSSSNAFCKCIRCENPWDFLVRRKYRTHTTVDVPRRNQSYYSVSQIFWFMVFIEQSAACACITTSYNYIMNINFLFCKDHMLNKWYCRCTYKSTSVV